MSCKNLKQQKNRSNLVYQYDNPMYADSDNNIEVHNDNTNEINDDTNNPYKGYYSDTNYSDLQHNGDNNHINNKDLYQVDFVQPSESYLEILENNKTTTDL